MRVLLLNPINRSYVIMPSIGLGYLASVLMEHGHTVTLLNCIKEKMSYAGFREYLAREPFDVIGFQVYSYDLNSVRKHLDIVRQVLPAAVAIAGGPHPSGDPAGILTYLPKLDFAFQGEAETGLPMLLDSVSRGKVDYPLIPGLVWRRDGLPVVNSQAVVENLDELPFPAWNLLLPETYPEAPHGAFTRAFPTAPMVFTRGCPCGCTFCAGHVITGRQVRRRSIENVLAEIRQLAKRGVREIHIEDENFTASRSYVIEFCNRLLSERLEMSWSLPSGIRLDTLDREMVLAMAAAGCYSLAVGIEFGSDRMLRVTGKGISVAEIKRNMELFQGSGIKVTGFFLFGIPGETVAEMEQTIDLALKLPLARAQFNIFMPLPGSREYEKMKGQGLLEDVDWDRFFVHDVACPTDTISRARLKSIQRTAVLRFYIRPRILAGLAREVRSFRHVRYLVRRLIDTFR